MDFFKERDASPMLIGKEAEPFNAPSCIFELKLDGERCLAYMDSKGMELRNKRQKLMNPHVPELTGIHRQVKKTCLLDGELTVIVNGVPNFDEIKRRSLMGNSFKIDLAAKKLPATFIAFDILYFDGKDLTKLPLMERKKILQSVILRESELLSVSRFIEEQGVRLFELAKEQKLEGIVAKKKNSLYRMGIRTKDWIKIKFLKDDDFVICGYIIKDKNITSLILGAYLNGTLVPQGHVTLGISRREFDIIAKQMPRSHSPFGAEEQNAVYVEPALACTVKYMERTAKGGLRQPVFKGLRLDKAAEDCLLRIER